MKVNTNRFEYQKVFLRAAGRAGVVPLSCCSWKRCVSYLQEAEHDRQDVFGVRSEVLIGRDAVNDLQHEFPQLLKNIKSPTVLFLVFSSILFYDKNLVFFPQKVRSVN